MIRPVLAAAHDPETRPNQLLAIGGIAVFSAVYFWAGPISFVRRWRGRPRLAAAFLGAMALAISLNEPEANWTILFIAAAVVAGAIRSARGALTAIVLIAALAMLARVAASGPSVGVVESGFAVIISGLIVFSLDLLDRTARKLTVAQAEVGRLAAADERARIARDVHDLLGHSLSVIVLKSELARRLVGDDPGRASAELRDIEGVARSSLRDVRDTVAGYRQITLDTELTGAEVALSAAGIAVDVERTTDRCDDATEALLGWIVREGVTNVIRHSTGAHCTIRIEAFEDDVRLEIVDDGRADDGRRPSGPTAPGSGLAGIRERLEGVGGRLESGPLQGGGFRLVAVVPGQAGPGPVRPTGAGHDRQRAGAPAEASAAGGAGPAVAMSGVPEAAGGDPG